MAIASAVVVPVNRGGDNEVQLEQRLNGASGVEVRGRGDKGIAVVLEAVDLKALEALSAEINDWEEVLEFQLVYYNWEEVKGSD